jgi:VIT1/CCC1 family predicted Fe2+/Mn2+ transporter
MINTKETLLLQKRAGIITEGQYKEKISELETIYELDDEEKEVVDDIKDEVSSILKGMENELNKAAEKEQPTNEGLLTATSIAVALPAVMGLISKLGKSAGNVVNKVLGKKPDEETAYQQWMSKLGHIADELHHLYMSPIESIVKKFIKDETKAKKIANGIFHIIVAVFLVASGVTAVKALQAKNISLATLESALGAIKGGEIKTYISKLIA